MATKAEIEQAHKDVKDKAQLISLAEMRVRNLRDVHQTAQGKVREWQTRLAKDPALAGYDLEAFVEDVKGSEQAFADFSRASVEAARLRLDEREAHHSYMANQGREPQSHASPTSERRG